MSPNYYEEGPMCESKMESAECGDESKLMLVHKKEVEDDETEVEEEEEEEDEEESNNNNLNGTSRGGGNYEYEEDEDDMISVGGSPLNESHDEYFTPFKKLRMVKVEPPSSQNGVGLKSFSISDILSHKPSKVDSVKIVRPWDEGQTEDLSSLIHHHQHILSTHHHHHHHTNHHSKKQKNDSSPLDALFQMTSKTFEGLNGHHDGSDHSGQGSAHQAFNSRQPPKKKRKSRTAFTNPQIFELERRFLYQKYLSPADRDDIAQQLGLTNAQVITWFQNRRAKMKRDMEELKKDMESAKLLSAHKNYLESAHDFGMLKKRAQSQMDMTSAAAAAAFQLSSPNSSSHSSPINLTASDSPNTTI